MTPWTHGLSQRASSARYALPFSVLPPRLTRPESRSPRRWDHPEPHQGGEDRWPSDSDSRAAGDRENSNRNGDREDTWGEDPLHDARWLGDFLAGDVEDRGADAGLPQVDWGKDQGGSRDHRGRSR